MLSFRKKRERERKKEQEAQYETRRSELPHSVNFLTVSEITHALFMQETVHWAHGYFLSGGYVFLCAKHDGISYICSIICWKVFQHEKILRLKSRNSALGDKRVTRSLEISLKNTQLLIHRSILRSLAPRPLNLWECVLWKWMWWHHSLQLSVCVSWEWTERQTPPAAEKGQSASLEGLPGSQKPARTC